MQTRLAPLRNALQLLLESILCELPTDAHVLCVGAGTGSELIALAQRFPEWTFTAVEPSAPMLEVCQRKVNECGIASRCDFHGGYLDSLPLSDAFDAATSLLVSQFVLDPASRSDFFREIFRRLKPGGWLVNADLAADTKSHAYQRLLEIWWRTMRTADVPAEGLERMRAAYGRDVAVLPPETVQALMVSGGFGSPVQFLQTGLIHAWYALRATQE